jgi:phosphate transport system substrate-binding protein
MRSLPSCSLAFRNQFPEELTMKKRFAHRIIILVILCLGTNICLAKDNKEELTGTITLSGAWALYPMAVKWAEEFQKIHPDVKIDIAAGGAGKGMADCLAEVVDIGMVSREIYPEEIKKGAWWISVTKDAVVPTVNAKNPVLSDLLSKGVKRQTLIGVWITGDVKNWGQVVGSDSKQNIHVYTRSDACGAAQTWAEYLDKKQEDLLDVGVYGDPGLAEAVRSDILGIGFNNINYAYDAKTKESVEGIRVLPLDLNENGRIDENENFYRTSDDIVRAIAEGKYPSPPARNLHFVSHGKPEKTLVLAFIKWVLTDGQKYVPESGYINLTEAKLKEGLNKLELK